MAGYDGAWRTSMRVNSDSAVVTSGTIAQVLPPSADRIKPTAVAANISWELRGLIEMSQVVAESGTGVKFWPPLSLPKSLPRLPSVPIVPTHKRSEFAG